MDGLYLGIKNSPFEKMVIFPLILIFLWCYFLSSAGDIAISAAHLPCSLHYHYDSIDPTLGCGRLKAGTQLCKHVQQPHSPGESM